MKQIDLIPIPHPNGIYDPRILLEKINELVEVVNGLLWIAHHNQGKHTVSQKTLDALESFLGFDLQDEPKFPSE